MTVVIVRQPGVTLAAFYVPLWGRETTETQRRGIDRIVPLGPESPGHSLHGNAPLGDPLISLIHLEGLTSQNKATGHLLI